MWVANISKTKSKIEAHFRFNKKSFYIAIMSIHQFLLPVSSMVCLLWWYQTFCRKNRATPRVDFSSMFLIWSQVAKWVDRFPQNSVFFFQVIGLIIGEIHHWWTLKGHIWVFPKIMVPPNHPLKNRGCSMIFIINHPFLVGIHHYFFGNTKVAFCTLSTVRFLVFFVWQRCGNRSHIKNTSMGLKKAPQ